MMRISKMRHPGKIEVYEAGTNRLVKTLDASTLPDAVRFAEVKGGGLVPVVRVLTQDAGREVHVREFGADGSLLRSSTRIKSSS
jgi:hypothetical protein